VHNNEKRRGGQSPGDILASSQQWWTDHTVSYDWKSPIPGERFSAPWFDELDRRFIFAHRLFAYDTRPFGRIIPFERIAGQRVLEIGCGMGLHTKCLAKAGAQLTSIDISETSIEATRRRLQLKGLTAETRRMDAQALNIRTRISTLSDPGASFTTRL
jgi:2-polyprenyl-3-methyl-5-hydroxy-6-metoxy-1,4-benzoquinol methylase